MDASPTWADDDSLPENRGMGNFIILPDERLFLANGVGAGSAGYGWDSVSTCFASYFDEG